MMCIVFKLVAMTDIVFNMQSIKLVEQGLIQHAEFPTAAAFGSVHIMNATFTVIEDYK